jgi:hypothetical protein
LRIVTPKARSPFRPSVCPCIYTRVYPRAYPWAVLVDVCRPGCSPTTKRLALNREGPRIGGLR